MINVSLKSDFHDYYDHMFDIVGQEFKRMSVTDLSRSEAFGKLTAMGLATPAWGPVQSLYSTLPAETLVVVYMDEYAHRSEGKSRMTIEQAIGHCNKIASVYVPNIRSAISLRYLRIGERIFWLIYSSQDEWRSNYGDVSITNGAAPPYLKRFRDAEPMPMLAIDFVKCLYGGWLAIDYNTAPGLRGTPVEDAMSATEVMNEIVKWFSHGATFGTLYQIKEY